MRKLDRFVDPIVVVSPRPGVYWTPNGYHGLSALEKLKAETVPAILIPEAEVAFQILALNTEKAHNLKEESLDVIRMYRGLAEEEPRGGEQDHAFQFEAPHLITLGLLYGPGSPRASRRGRENRAHRRSMEWRRDPRRPAPAVGKAEALAFLQRRWGFRPRRHWPSARTGTPTTCSSRRSWAWSWGTPTRLCMRLGLAVLPTNDEDGVAVAGERYVLSRQSAACAVSPPRAATRRRRCGR